MRNKRRLCWLDFIRVFAMFCIIIFHFNCSIVAHGVYSGRPIIFYDYVNGNGANIGVTLFFIISGSSLMYTYDEEFNLKKYCKKRWLGIFPIYYLAWIAGMLFYFYKYSSLNPFGLQRERWTILLTILGMDGYLSGIFPNYYILGEWFLGCIILLYICFPILLFLKEKSNINKLFVISFAFYFYIVISYNIQFPIDMFFLTRIFDIVFGMFVICKIKRLKMYHILPFLAIVFIFMKCFINIHPMFKNTIFGISLFMILLYVGQNIKGKGETILRFFSKYSYAVFLVHHIVLEQLCTHFEGAQFGILEICFVLTIALLFIFLSAYLLQTTNTKILDFLVKHDD